MLENVEILRGSKFSDILKSGELTLLLLKTYSVLFLDGSQASACSSCMRNYYNKILTNGLKKVNFMKDQTNKLKPGLHFVRSQGMHYSTDNLTDAKAIELLNSKDLIVAQFEILPKGFEASNEAPAIKLDESAKGNFTNENLTLVNGAELIEFAKAVTGEKPASKKAAIESILNWQK